jgi:ankyrin repeat protein
MNTLFLSESIVRHWQPTANAAPCIVYPEISSKAIPEAMPEAIQRAIWRLFQTKILELPRSAPQPSPKLQTKQYAFKQNSTDQEQEPPPLFKAVWEGDLQSVAALVDQGADVNRSTMSSLSPLLAAAFHGHLEIIKFLMQHGADINQADSTGITPLWISAAQGHLEAVKLLVEKGAQLNLTENNGVSPIAAAINHQEIVQFLLAHEADPNQRDITGISPLIRAAVSGHTNTVSLLIKYGANVNQANDQQRSALHAAAISGNQETVKLLIEKGAHIHQTDYQGFTPLFLAACEGYAELVRFLVEQGADINQQDHDGNTPLLLAASQPKLLPIVQLLNSMGADLEKPNKNDLTPLLIASLAGHIEIAQWIISRAKTLNPLSEGGLTPLAHVLGAKTHQWKQISQMFSAKDPSTYPLAKEIMLRKLLAHIAEVGGSTLLPPLGSLPLEGFLAAYWYRKIAKSIQPFHNTLPESLSSTLAQALIRAYSANASNDYEKVFEQWRSGEPVVIQSGFRKHYIGVLIWRNLFITCDRAHLLSAQSYQAFKFNSQALNINLIRKIKGSFNSEKTVAQQFFKEELPGQLNFSQTLFEKKLETISISQQKVGNCSWANLSGIVLPLLVLYQYHVPGGTFARKLCSDDPLRTHAKIFERIVKKQQAIFQQWEAFHQYAAAQKYLERITQPNCPYPPDFELLSKALCKTIPSARIDQRIQAKWAELNQTFLQTAPKYTQMKHRLRLQAYALCAWPAL